MKKIVLLASALLIAGTAYGQEVRSIKRAVVLDANGVRVGERFGNLPNNVPLFPEIMLTVDNRLVSLFVDRQTISGAQLEVFFAGLSCSGQAFIQENAPDLRVIPLAEVGVPGNTLYIEDPGAVPAPVTTASRSVITGPPPVCVDETRSIFAVTASPVIDLFTLFTPPFRLEPR